MGSQVRLQRAGLGSRAGWGSFAGEVRSHTRSSGSFPSGRAPLGGPTPASLHPSLPGTASRWSPGRRISSGLAMEQPHAAATNPNSRAGAEQAGLFVWEELGCCRSIRFPAKQRGFPAKQRAARCLDHFSRCTSFKGICLINAEHRYAAHTCTEGKEAASAALTPQPGFGQENSPAPCRKESHEGLPFPLRCPPPGMAPVPCPHPRVTREVLSSPGIGLCLQPRPAATSPGAAKVWKCLQLLARGELRSIAGRKHPPRGGKPAAGDAEGDEGRAAG